jgi:hypothetical protein
VKRRFEFRLERLRRVRDIEERLARGERAGSEGLARNAEDLRDRARSALDNSRDELQRMLEGPIDPGQVVLMNNLLDAELVIQRRLIESARTLRTQAERMAEAHRERRGAALALDELRDRARTRHLAELTKDDNATQDEVAQRMNQLRRRADGEAASDKPESDSRTDTGPADQTDPGDSRRAS